MQFDGKRDNDLLPEPNWRVGLRNQRGSGRKATMNWRRHDDLDGALRTLQFDGLGEAAKEAESLLASGYRRHGQWSLGQICRHLCLVQDPCMDGYPAWMSLFAPIRPVMRRTLMRKILSGDSPVGIRTAPRFAPPDDVADRREVEALRQSVERFLEFDEPFYPHPAFGRMDAKTFEAVHTAHAAHHLRFLSPASQ